MQKRHTLTIITVLCVQQRGHKFQIVDCRLDAKFFHLHTGANVITTREPQQSSMWNSDFAQLRRDFSSRDDLC